MVSPFRVPLGCPGPWPPRRAPRGARQEAGQVGGGDAADQQLAGHCPAATDPRGEVVETVRRDLDIAFFQGVEEVVVGLIGVHSGFSFWMRGPSCCRTCSR